MDQKLSSLAAYCLEAQADVCVVTWRQGYRTKLRIASKVLPVISIKTEKKIVKFLDICIHVYDELDFCKWSTVKKPQNAHSIFGGKVFLLLVRERERE